MHERAYRLLEFREPLRGPASTRGLEGLRQLWAARLLNLMGATELAASLLSRVEATCSDDHRVIGSIHLAAFEFARALSHFEKMRALDREPGRYLSRLALVNLADSLSGLGEYERAIRVALGVHERSGEPLLKGIALAAVGEYHARAGRFVAAKRALAAASPFFPEGDRSPDFAILTKWRGYVSGRRGDPREARRCLGAAFSIFRETSLRPEAWLDVLRLRHELGLLPAADLRRLVRFPGLAPGFRAVLPGARQIPRRGARWRIDLARDEYWVNGTPFLGIPLELRAAALIALAGDWSIPVVRLKSLLWPEEAHAYLQLEGRLHQLLLRLRREHGIGVELDARRLRLSEEGDVEVVTEADDPRPSLLRARGDVSRRAAQDYYRLSTTNACGWVARWRERGWL